MLTSTSGGEPNPLGPGLQGQEVRGPSPQVSSAAAHPWQSPLSGCMAATLPLPWPGPAGTPRPPLCSHLTLSFVLGTILLQSGPSLNVPTPASLRQVTTLPPASVSPPEKWPQGTPARSGGDQPATSRVPLTPEKGRTSTTSTRPVPGPSARPLRREPRVAAARGPPPPAPPGSGLAPHPDLQVDIPQGNAALVQIEAELVQAEVLLEEVTQVVVQQVAADALLHTVRPWPQPS